MSVDLATVVELLLSLPPGTVMETQVDAKGEVVSIDGKKVEEDQ